MSRRGRLVALSLSLALASGVSWAQPAPPQAQSQTQSPLDATIAAALALRVEGRDAEALALLTRAWEETRSPRARAQMARAEQAVGRWLDAEQHMTEALASEDPWVIARRASLEEERTRVRAHLGRVELLGLPDGARVRIDGRGPYALPLAEPPWSAVGTVLVEVEADGYFPAARRVVVDVGATTRETISLVRTPTEPPPVTPPVAPPVNVSPSPHAPPVTDAPASSVRATLGLAGIIAGATFAVGGLAAHIARELAVSAAADQGCGYDPSGRLVGPTDCVDRVSSINVATALTVTGYALGATLLGAGVALVVTAPRARSNAAWSCAPSLLCASCALRF